MTGIADLAFYAFNPHGCAVIATALLELLLATVLLIRQRPSPSTSRFALIALPVSIWLFGIGFASMAGSEALSRSWSRFAYAGVSLIGPAVYAFAVALLGLAEKRRNLAAIFWTIGVLFAATAVQTNFIVARVVRDAWGFYPRYGTLGFLFVAFCVTTIVAALFEFVRAYRSVPRTSRDRVSAWLIGFGITAIALVDHLTAFGIRVYPFGFLAILAFIGLASVMRRRYWLVSLTPEFAAKEIVETLRDAVIVCDVDQRVHVVNHGARQLLARRDEELLGQPLSEVLQSDTPISLTVGRSVEQQLVLRSGEQAIPVAASISPLRDNDMDAGWVVLLRDLREARHAEGEIKRNETLLRSTLNSTGEGILVLDSHRNIALFNNRAAEMWGVDEELVRKDGREAMRLAIEKLADPEGFRERARRADWMTAEHSCDILEMKDGRTLERYSFPHHVDGEIVGRVWSFRDITPQRTAQRAIETSEKRYRLLFERNVAGVFMCSEEGRIVSCNEAFARIVEADPSEVIGRFISEVHASPREQREMFTMLHAVATLPSVELTFRTLRGKEVRVLETISRIDIDEQWMIQGTVVDVSDLKRAEEQIRFYAYHDVLTTLPNRQLFRDRLRTALLNAGRAHRNAALLLIDVDDFKKVNDTLGHTVGDEALVALAERLKKALRSGDTLARPGGDEFQILLPTIDSSESVERVARKMLHTIAKPILIGERDVVLTASIGVAVFPTDGDDDEALMKSADSALFEAKQRGRNTYRLATEEIGRRAMERFAVETALRRSIDANEFELYYQPIVDATTKRVVSLEALVRWNHPERGTLPPREFIVIAEETWLIEQLGEWIIQRAMKDAAAWQQNGMKDVRVSVNISPKQFQSRGLSECILGSLKSSAIPPSLVELEITESVAAQDPDQAAATLRALRELGVRVAIDDIGTGYSSLGYLKQFPVTTVKIDQSFIRNVVTDRSDAAIVNAVIAVAHSLEMDVVAEGVETSEQAEFLTERRCNLLQGFFFGRPMPLEELLRSHESIASA